MKKDNMLLRQACITFSFYLLCLRSSSLPKRISHSRKNTQAFQSLQVQVLSEPSQVLGPPVEEKHPFAGAGLKT